MYDNKKCHAENELERELWELENMKSQKIDDNIELGKGRLYEWKYRYYNHYFNSSSINSDVIEKTCNMYLEGLIWVARYYFKGCNSWEWHYYYDHAPFLSDLAQYFKQQRSNGFDINNIQFNDNSEKITPFEQLLAILPPVYSNILPINYQKLMTDPKSMLIDLYPTEIEYDMIDKDLYWQCIPLLPALDIKRIKKYTKDIKLNKSELIRNKDLEPFNLS